MDNQKLWNSVLADVELTVSKANFNTWFKDTFVSKKEGGIVHLSVPNAFVKEWLSTKYHSHILKALRSISDDVRSLEYTISKNKSSDKKHNDARKSDSHLYSEENTLPLNDFYINKEDNLNPKYTFDNFVVGSFNELAFAASQAVIKRPGIAYNPLFIYGNTGHGKTHLIQAIGNSIKSAYPEKRVHYVTSEKFAMDYINSVQANKVNNFKEKYRKYDVLIMDDIQFLSSKEKTQEELFHLFNNVFDNNKQIIFSSDKHPNYIPNLEDRLKSRFGAGMIVDIPAPDQDSRAAIIREKAKNNGFSLSTEIIEFLASSITTNVREIEGIINSVVCQSELRQKDLTLTEVKNLIKTSVKPKKSISPKEVIKVISDFYNIKEENIYEKTRRKEIIKPRQVIMYVLREDFNISYPLIGEQMGGRDHTTVIHSCKKVKGDLKRDSILSQELEQIRSILN